MKKKIVTLLGALLIVCSLASCGNTNTESEETTRKKVSTEAETETSTETTESTSSQKTYSEADYTFVKKFEAPTGSDYRQIVKDYFLKMANIEWTPKETFTVNWKKEGDFSVDLQYKAGTTYRGIIYSETRAAYDLFDQCLTDGKFTSPTTDYYEEIVGNHCSASIDMAYQNLYNFTHISQFIPSTTKVEMLNFPIELTIPENKNWISTDLFTANGRDKIFEAYCNLKTGDILYRKTKKSGHVRMVDSVNVSYTAAGAINFRSSYVVTIEQTNVFESKENTNFVSENGYDTTWFIDHKYTFEELYDKEFMPLAVDFLKSTETLEDAYIVYDGNVSADTVVDGINGSVISNFPINYVWMTIKDKSGNTVSQVLVNNLNPTYSSEYSVVLRNYHYDLMKDVPSGTYTFTLRAGIARGGCEITSFEFTK